VNTQPQTSLDRALDEALVVEGTPTLNPQTNRNAGGAEVSALIALAGDLARLPKAPGPTPDFTRALAARLSEASLPAHPDPALAERLDAALSLDTPATSAPTASIPAELVELVTLAADLKRLPAAPTPRPEFTTVLAARLAALPAPAAFLQPTTAAQPTQDLLQVLDQSLDALVEGRQDPRSVLLAACAHDARTAGELAPLLDLAVGLRSLPSAPDPELSFRAQLAKTLRKAPWPRSLTRQAPSAPWSWLAALWRSTAAMATAAATLLLFLGRDHLPSVTDAALDAQRGELRQSGGEAVHGVPVLQLSSANPQRPDGEPREGRPMLSADAPPAVMARPRALAASRPTGSGPTGSGQPPAPALVAMVAMAPAATEATAPGGGAPSDDQDDDKDDDRDRAEREAARRSSTIAPTAAPLVFPTEPAPTEPAPTEPPAPRPTTEPQPTPPVIPANEPPRILGLTCTPDQVEEAGSAECRVEVDDDGGLEGVSFEWQLQGVGPELSDPRAATVTFTASGNGGGLGWQGEFVLVIIVRDAQGLETRGRTQVTITPTQP
jgi:hypothetical protein